MMGTCALLTIGTELLEGSVIDTNSAFIGNALFPLGIKPLNAIRVPDNRDLIISAIKNAASLYPLVIAAGGLGPTFDDITSECAAEAAGVKLLLNEFAYNHIKDRLNKIGVTMRESHKRQALLPEGCDIFKNNAGTACAFGINIGNSYCIFMPGVPHEMKTIFNEYIAPFLKEKFSQKEIYHRELLFGLVPESDVDAAILDLGMPKNIECIINAGKSEIVVKLRSENEQIISDFALKLAEKFPDNFMGYNISSSAEALVKLLQDNGKTFCTAESCTGGLIGKLITDFSGVSSFYKGSIVSYSNEAKKSLLEVKEETLYNYGAVSGETAEEMAFGAVKAFNSDYAVSVTGIAGPSGGSENKPIGTVYIGVSSGGRTISKKFLFRGTRESIRQCSANAAMFTACKFIRGIN